MTWPAVEPQQEGTRNTSTRGAGAGADAEAAQAYLAGLADPLARLAREHGAVDFTLPSHGVVLPDPLERLTLSIVGQLISVRAALVIFGRLRDLLGGRIDAAGLARLDEGTLRQVGLTRAKAKALHELGSQLVSGSFGFDAIASLSDTEAEAQLVALRGVGSWSAQMFLLRGMARPDVFPAGDLGLRRGIESLYALRELPSIPEAAERALAWRPYRSYAAKYLWLHYAAVADA